MSYPYSLYCFTCLFRMILYRYYNIQFYFISTMVIYYITISINLYSNSLRYYTIIEREI